MTQEAKKTETSAPPVADAKHEEHKAAKARAARPKPKTLDEALRAIDVDALKDVEKALADAYKAHDLLPTASDEKDADGRPIADPRIGAYRDKCRTALGKAHAGAVSALASLDAFKGLLHTLAGMKGAKKPEPAKVPANAPIPEKPATLAAKKKEHAK